jgi:hypothetical protein
MNETSRRPQRKNPLDFRALLDYFMGLLMIFFGVFIAFSAKFIGYDYFEGTWLANGTLKWMMAGLFALYGLFRGYRGYLQTKRGKDFEE